MDKSWYICHITEYAESASPTPIAISMDGASDLRDLRLIAYTHMWKGSFARLFTRLFTAVRDSMWSYFNLTSFLASCVVGQHTVQGSALTT